MESKINYTVVGLVVLLLFSGLVATGLWLSIGFDQKTYVTYAVHMNEAVSGLSDDSPVKFNGVKVGYVKSIELDRADPQRVTILLNIEAGTPVTVSTYATLISQGITGTTIVGLAATSSDVVLLQKKAGRPYAVIPAKPSLLTQLDKVITEVSDNVNEVAKEIKRVFDKDNANALKKTLANIEEFTHVLSVNSGKFNHTLQNLDTLIANASMASKQLPQVVKNLDTGMQRFNETVLSLKHAGKGITTTMSSGKVALDAFSQQIVPPFVQVLNRLNVITSNLEGVSHQMEQNPAVVIKGVVLANPGPGE